MAALRVRKGIPRVDIPLQIVLPRPVVRAGLLCRKGCREVAAVTRVGKDRVWLTRWTTAGDQLPFGADWLYYAAIMSLTTAHPGKSRIHFQGVTEVCRMAAQLGVGTQGGAMTRRTADAIRRLCQAQFGWHADDLEVGNVSAAQQLRQEPVLRISSGLATALWPREAPTGILIEADDALWIEPTVAHLVITRDYPFHVVRDIFSALAARPPLMSLALVIAAYAQATSRPFPLQRATWEAFVTRISDCPLARVRQRVLEAVSLLESACCAAGYPGSVQVFDPTTAVAGVTKGTSRNHGSVPDSLPTRLPGRPKSKWILTIAKAKPPFVRA